MIVTSNINPPELTFGQGVLYCSLETLHYDLADRHKLTSHIKEDIEFQ
jgi:hypothetical protein